MHSMDLSDDILDTVQNRSGKRQMENPGLGIAQVPQNDDSQGSSQSIDNQPERSSFLLCMLRELSGLRTKSQPYKKHDGIATPNF